MNNLSAFLMVFLFIFLTGCSVRNVMGPDYEAAYRQQMKEMGGVSAGGCPTGNCADAEEQDEPDLSNPKTKAVYDAEAKRVGKILQSIENCKARNQARGDNGLPPKKDCSKIAAREFGRMVSPHKEEVAAKTINKWSSIYNPFSNPYPRPNPFFYYTYPSYYYYDNNYYGGYGYGRGRGHAGRNRHDFNRGRERMHHDYRHGLRGDH